MTRGEMTELPSEWEGKGKWVLWIAGALSILLGIGALIYPFAASIGFEIAFGAVLIAAGLVEIFRGFQLRKFARFIWNILFGVVAVVTGGVLLFFPLEGVMTLTAILSGFFFAGGIMKMVSAFSLHPRVGWGWMMLSALVSVTIGIMLFMGLPGSAFWAIGILVGVDLVFLGVAQIMIGSALGQLEEAHD
ncbi:MAG: HdeD family acid-resistance protein [Methylohalobius sp. ZOD2]